VLAGTGKDSEGEVIASFGKADTPRHLSYEKKSIACSLR
jgi:hypothetical protein